MITTTIITVSFNIPEENDKVELFRQTHDTAIWIEEKGNDTISFSLKSVVNSNIYRYKS